VHFAIGYRNGVGLTIGPDGSLSAPNLYGGANTNRPLAALYEKSDTQSISSDLWTTLSGLTQTYNNGTWSYAAGVWTFPVDGLYDLAATVYFDGVASPTGRRGVRWLYGGTVDAGAVVVAPGPSTSGGVLNVASTVVGGAGTSVRIQVYQSQGGALAAGAAGVGANARFSLK